jgi:hypothetical protein
VAVLKTLEVGECVGVVRTEYEQLLIETDGESRMP